MLWPAVLIALSFAAMLGWLVLAQDWQPWFAFIAIGGSAIALAFALVLLIMCLADDRTGAFSRLFNAEAYSRGRDKYYFHDKIKTIATRMDAVAEENLSRTTITGKIVIFSGFNIDRELAR